MSDSDYKVMIRATHPTGWRVLIHGPSSRTSGWRYARTRLGVRWKARLIIASWRRHDRRDAYVKDFMVTRRSSDD